ncbi:MAG: lipopolysaccharide heptosyltransferase I [Burkholderiales bacterium]
MRILLVKTSSMGDVIHNLPVASDIRHAFPAAQIDWIVEESLVEIPRCHAQIRQVIPVALRRWRRRPLGQATREEFGALRKFLRENPYDAIIDTQGLLKSAFLARLATGVRHGLNWRSAREPLRMFYDHVYEVPWTLHAVERNRMLAARALGYRSSGAPDFGLQAVADRRGVTGAVNAEITTGVPFAVFLHATSAVEKEWPESHWVALGNQLAADEIVCVLPFGNAAERARSERLATRIPQARVPSALGLRDLGEMLSLARFVVGVDTGLSHFSAALGTPTVGIFCATHPAATGLYGSPRAINIGGPAGGPEVDETMAAIVQVTGTR